MSKTIFDILKGGQKIIEKGLKQELKDQGHYLTGKLERSLSADVKGNDLEGKGLDYLLKLDKGVPASEVRIDSAALAEMTKYVELRMGFKGRKAAQVAYRILLKQSKEGVPTKNSSKFSKTGERKNALKNGFSKTETQLDNHILNGVDELINEIFNIQKSEVL